MALSSVKSILDFQLDIDEEFQGWVLLFTTVTAIFFFCLPCYCAGLSLASARQFASWLSRRLPAFYCCMSAFNLLFLGLVIHWLPAWDVASYLKVLATTILAALQHILDCASSIAVIVAFCVAVAFKDRIAQLFGFDHRTLFRFKMRDCLTCWGPARFRPIELAIWKVEDLASADLFSANNVFVEFYLGYNEVMKTRVHNNAGSGCVLKEHIHLNFDENDEEEKLYIFVRNQKVMGTSEVAHTEISTEELKNMVQAAEAWGEQAQTQWSDDFFREPSSLIPRGKLWLHAKPLRDEDYSLMQDLTTC